jgi:hypothetical protein
MSRGRYSCLQAEAYVIDGTQASKPQISVAVRHCEIPALGVLILALGRQRRGCCGSLEFVGRANFLNRRGGPGKGFSGLDLFSSARGYHSRLD